MKLGYVLIGYARGSTQDQNIDLQREALTKADAPIANAIANLGLFEL